MNPLFYNLLGLTLLVIIIFGSGDGLKLGLVECTNIIVGYLLSILAFILMLE
jgi:hypothetical protein